MAKAKPRRHELPEPRSARIGKQGRIVIPAIVRKQAGIKVGDRLTIVSVEAGLVTMRTIDRSWSDAAKALDEAREGK